MKLTDVMVLAMLEIGVIPFPRVKRVIFVGKPNLKMSKNSGGDDFGGDTETGAEHPKFYLEVHPI